MLYHIQTQWKQSKKLTEWIFAYWMLRLYRSLLYTLGIDFPLVKRAEERSFARHLFQSSFPYTATDTSSHSRALSPCARARCADAGASSLHSPRCDAPRRAPSQMNGEEHSAEPRNRLAISRGPVGRESRRIDIIRSAVRRREQAASVVSTSSTSPPTSLGDAETCSGLDYAREEKSLYYATRVPCPLHGEYPRDG